MPPLAENSVIGILGGGQLGRMCTLAAATLGYRCHVFAPDGDAPATDIAYASTRADYSDKTALNRFASNVASVITEFENVPVAAVDYLAQQGLLVCPGSTALATAQDRIAEKTYAQKLGIATPKFMPISTSDALTDGLAEFGGGIVKTCRFGYDGLGQVRLGADADAGDAIASLTTKGSAPNLILEEIVDFAGEASFLVARNPNGDMLAWDATMNTHQNGILYQSQAPAASAILPAHLAKQGKEACLALAEGLGVVGLLAVEMFITRDGRLLFNEMAPRPHNSYHWTIEGAATSQFTQLIRIAAGLGLGSCATHANTRWQMTNILGDVDYAAQLTQALSDANAFIHRYGKSEARPRRKMGHITRRIYALPRVVKS